VPLLRPVASRHLLSLGQGSLLLAAVQLTLSFLTLLRRLTSRTLPLLMPRPSRKGTLSWLPCSAIFRCALARAWGSKLGAPALVRRSRVMTLPMPLLCLAGGWVAASRWVRVTPWMLLALR
jgi:hypothetical protein